MEGFGIFVQKFKIKPLKETNLGLVRALLEDTEKWNSLNYQLLFRKGARTSIPDLRDWQKLSLKTEIKGFRLQLECTLEDTCTAKNSGKATLLSQTVLIQQDF